MTIGINLSLRNYRDMLRRQSPPWMELNDPDLLEYFSLSGHTYLEKVESIIIDGTEYIRDEWTLGELKADIGVVGTGDYDNCSIDIIELIDDNDSVYIYTNPNYSLLDAEAVLQKSVDNRRNQLISEMNPLKATVSGMLPFWEALFQSSRQYIGDTIETDAEYMGRAVSELFGSGTSLNVLRIKLAKYNLSDFTVINSRDDSFHWNSFSEACSVSLYLDPSDYNKIDQLKTTFLNTTLAGMRLFIFCPTTDHDCYGLNYGNAQSAVGYSVPTPALPA